jgi:CheY-like chemotaxis protein
VRDLVCEALEQRGYRVHTAADGLEALQICERPGLHIDLLLTDVVMPKMRGRALAERVSALFPAAKVLYMSGYAEDFIVPGGVPGGELEFIAKPFTTDALAARVREVLDRK